MPEARGAFSLSATGVRLWAVQRGNSQCRYETMYQPGDRKAERLPDNVYYTMISSDNRQHNGQRHDAEKGGKQNGCDNEFRQQIIFDGNDRR